MTFRINDEVIALRQNDVVATIVEAGRPSPLEYTIEYKDGNHRQQRHAAADSLRLHRAAPEPVELTNDASSDAALAENVGLGED